MDWNAWINWVFQASLFFTVFSIGLRASHRDAMYLFRYPRALLVSVLSMAVVMPAFAVAATLLLDLHPAVEVALVALSISPIPPFLPLRVMKAGGKPGYTISLLAISAMLSVLVIPLAVAVFSEVYAVQARRTPMDILPVVLASVLLPLGLGMAARAWKPSLAEDLAGILPVLAMALLFLSLLFILLGLREAVFELVGPSTLAALGGFALLGFLVGDLLGGLKPEDRTVLAFATAMRHPGVALAVAHGRDATDQVVFAAVLMYLLLGILVSSLYMAGRRRFEAGSGPSHPAAAGLAGR
jgi:bile acid:Na+ symporter, BASS family